METHLLLGCHHILVAGTEDLIYLGHRLGAVGHGADGLHSASLEDMADTCNARCHEDGGIDLALAIGRSAKHYLTTAGYLGGGGKHEHGAEQRGGATGDIQAHLVDGHALLPTGDSRLGAHLAAHKALRLMEGADVVVGQSDG